jgi:hypothetical protein
MALQDDSAHALRFKMGIPTIFSKIALQWICHKFIVIESREKLLISAYD